MKMTGGEIVVDYLVLCKRSAKKTVPCILSKEYFSDILDVKEPYTKMYYRAGITQVPLKLFPKILARAQDSKLFVNLERIDPNGLNRKHVLTIGVEVDKRGRQRRAIQQEAVDANNPRR